MLEWLEAVSRPEGLPASVEGEKEEDHKDDTEYGENEYPNDEIDGRVRLKFNVVVLGDDAGLVEHVTKSPTNRDIIHLYKTCTIM